MLDVEVALATVDAYCDTAPRATADTEPLGPFTLFVARSGWPFYARPNLGNPIESAYDTRSLERVVARQRELDVPQSFEWVHERAPHLLDAAQELGLATEQRPLLVLDGPVHLPSAPGVTVEMLDPDDPRVADARAAVSAGFEGRDDLRPERVAAVIVQRARAGLIRVVGAFADTGRAVGGGTSAPRGTTTELTGIAVLPRARGRGVGAAITAVLARDGLDAGATTVWLSATDDVVARVYERVGFVRVGTTCEAQAPGDPEA